MAVNRLIFVILTSFVACFLLLFLPAHLLYVCLRRRRFHSEYAASAAVSDALADPYTSPSKELLYFLCWKAHSRIEPFAVVSTPAGCAGPPAPPLFGDGDSLKLQGVHGPSRFLLTIKEEREDSEAEEAKLPEAHKECLLVGVEETPFATPCTSPPFYTPRSSPTHGGVPEDDDGGGKFSDYDLRVIVD